MIVGHYAAAFAASALSRRVPLWLSATAVVALDILHSSLVLAGVEEARLNHGITAAVPVELLYYPYSHSLVAALFWSALMAGAFALLARPGTKAALLVGAAVLSHYLLDFIAHRPDLTLGLGDGPRYGLGLWNHYAATHLVENGLLFASLAWFVRARRDALAPHGARDLTLMCLMGTLIFFLIPVVQLPGDIRSAEVFMLVTYALAPWVCWRSLRGAPAEPLPSSPGEVLEPRR